MFTVHIKNKAPETGFNPEPASSHKTEDAAVEAAKALASDKSSYGRTVLVCEEGTNLTVSVEYATGEPSIGYEDGEPFLVPATDAHFLVTRDDREVPTEKRVEKNDETGGIVVYLDQPQGDVLVGNHDQTRHDIKPKNEVAS